jgi:hypothetical protein
VRDEELRMARELADSRLAEQRTHTLAAREHVEKLAAEVEYYRGKFDEALARADSQLDAVLAQVGLPAVTPTSKREERERAEDAKVEEQKRERELYEIFGESLGDAEADGLVLPSELKAEADKLIAGAR